MKNVVSNCYDDDNGFKDVERMQVEIIPSHFIHFFKEKQNTLYNCQFGLRKNNVIGIG